MTVIERHSSARHRAIFLSDVHLGTRGCQADLLLDFLKNNDAATIYLVRPNCDLRPEACPPRLGGPARAAAGRPAAHAAADRPG